MGGWNRKVIAKELHAQRPVNSEGSIPNLGSVVLSRRPVSDLCFSN